MIGDDPLAYLDEELCELERTGLLRRSDEPATSDLIVLCSNDYLGYAAEPWNSASSGFVRAGAGGSRLVTGEDAAHRRAERALASWVGAESALLFSSGYAANVGAIAALARPGDLIVSDVLNHASIIDGCRLSGAEIAIVPHVDAGAVARALRAGAGARRRWIVTESYFSMDGDSPDLEELRKIAYDLDAALFVDEAHALGVFGWEGAGLCAERGVHADVLVGTLGKAVGLQGAFVAGSRNLRTWLWNRARSFVFSTGVMPALANAVEERVERVREDDERRLRLRELGLALRSALAATSGKLLGRADGPIVPWVVGSSEAAMAASLQLRSLGVLVRSIRPPTVPTGTSRLRITANAALVEADLDRAVRALRAVAAPQPSASAPLG